MWRQKTEVLSFKRTKPSLKSFDKGVMVWGCMCSSGVGKIVIFEGKVTAVVYLQLLKDVIIPEGKRLIGEKCILQQDNAPIHKANVVKNYINSSSINDLIVLTESRSFTN